MTIHCVGDVMVDVLVELPGPLALGSDTPAPISFGHGGSAANTAAWLGSLGVAVTFTGRVGEDPAGDQAEKALRAAGVMTNLTWDPHAVTGTCIVLVTPDGERTMIPSAGANVLLGDPELAAITLVPGDRLHLSGYALLRAETRAGAKALLHRAVDAGVAISVDAASADPLAQLEPGVFVSWLPAGALLIANVDEACILTGTNDAQAAAERMLAAGVSGVVVKEGAAGAVVGQGDRAVRVSTVPVEVIDSTGAGDAFAAGLLAELSLGTDLVAAAAAGNRIGGIAVTGWGARP